MKKILWIFALAICAVGAHALDYDYLVFTNTSDVTTIISVSNLTLTVNGSDLQVTNADSNTTFLLTELKNMQFSKDGSVITATDKVLRADAAVEAYNLSGMRLGSFRNMATAAQSLSAGAYIITDGTNSQKIVVK